MLVPGEYLKYLGGSQELDSKGFVKNTNYVIYKGTIPPYDKEIYSANPVTLEKAIFIDCNGNITGKTAYFEPTSYEKKTKVSHKSSNCDQHVWKEYVGFSDSFTYCIKCDQKISN